MDTISQILVEKLLSATLSAFPTLGKQDVPMELVQSTQAKFGDYQFNSAMKLAKTLNSNPRRIAEAIVSRVDKDYARGPMIEKMEVAGPGFINISLDPQFISKRVDEVVRDSRLGIPTPEKVEQIIIDFSSPNIAKEMHVGHLRSTIIGDCLARLFEHLGHQVLRLNHVGDWGTAFGMLIAYMKMKNPEVLSGTAQTDLSHLVQWYKEAKQLFDRDPEFKKKSQQEVVDLQNGNIESLKAWSIICAVSRIAYQEIYDLLDIEIIERGESYYNPVLKATVDELEEKGLVTVSDGAKCIFLEGFKSREGNPLPLMVQKSDGGYNYDTTDLAAIKQRLLEEKGDRIIYVTDAGQHQHFQMIFKAAERAGYYDPKRVRVDHVGFGLVLGPDGKKFRTRAGDTERLIDLLDAAVENADKILMDRSPQMPAEERRNLAKALGIGAVKYADLSCHRAGDYVFSYERMLRFEGNTAAYLMYSYVRVAGIKRKIHADIEQVKMASHVMLEHPSEIALGVHILQFSEALEQAARELLPNRLTEYLYGLAEKFNVFYRDCPVEGSPCQNSRLLLCEAAARTIKQGLEILGLKTVDKM